LEGIYELLRESDWSFAGRIHRLALVEKRGSDFGKGIPSPDVGFGRSGWLGRVGSHFERN